MPNDSLRDLASGTNFAVISTLMPDGRPQTQVMWVDYDEGRILLNTEVHRQKYRNLQRDPRVTVTIWEMTNPYAYVEVRGIVEEFIRGPAALEHIDRLALKYTGSPFRREGITSERVILRIKPERQVTFGR